MGSLHQLRLSSAPDPSRTRGLPWLLAVFCLVSSASAQYRLDVWTADDGLPQNDIRAIQQTRDGYLWMATLDGLVRFDGLRFTVFNKSNSPGINSNRLTSLYEARNGELWLATEYGGVTRYRQGSFTTDTTQNGLPRNQVLGISGDDAGNLWVLAGDSIMQWQETAGRFIDVTPKDLRIPYLQFFWEGQGGFWGTDPAGLHCFRKGRFTTYRLPRWLSRSSITSAAEGQDGTIWLETADGKHARITNGNVEAVSANTSDKKVSINYRDGRGNSWTIGVGHDLFRFINYRSSGRMEKLSFFALAEDREGDLWFGTTSHGLCRLRRQAITTYSKQNGLVDRNVYPIYQDRAGAVWIGAWETGLSRFMNGKFTNYTPREGLPSNILTALAEDREGHLWVAGYGGIRILQDGRFREGPLLPDNRAIVSAIHQDGEGTFWFGTDLGLVRYRDGISTLYTAKDGLATDDVRTIIGDSAGGFWMGGYGGLTRFRSGQFTSWTERDGLHSNNVRSLYEDSSGVLWIGTYDGGLGRFKDGAFTRYTMREGLFNNGVFQILEDARGNFWMSCNRGIYRVSKQELNGFAAGALRTITSVVYGRSDGMLNVECNGGRWPAGIKARDGKLWFPTQDGVAVFDPEAVPTNPQPPPVLIESFLLDRAPVPFDRSLRIAPGQDNFEIGYTALSFVNPERDRFKYKLAGLDSDWNDVGPRRTAYYSHVPPGHYVFRVIAANSDGVWNTEGQSLRITVLPPLYRTWWFVTLASAALAGMVSLVWRRRVAHLKLMQATQQAFARQLMASQESERKRIAGELHDSLGQRLVIIKNLALMFLQAPASTSASHGDALRPIEEISAEASHALGEVREISYNLRPYQLDRIGLTKALEALSRTAAASSSITFRADIDDVDHFFAAESEINFYRIVQESVTNIVKHSQASRASVRVQRDPERLRLVVHDDGKGFTPGAANSAPQAGGFGLIGISERAQLLGGAAVIQSAPGEGTTIIIEIDSRGLRNGR
jgi:signal transduction histidine kinase/ligand-binding sensor domain-containing protein